jgi:hypothetical protein
MAPAILLPPGPPLEVAMSPAVPFRPALRQSDPLVRAVIAEARANLFEADRNGARVAKQLWLDSYLDRCGMGRTARHLPR